MKCLWLHQGSFNDPFDCRIPENYHLLNTQEKIDQFMEYIESKHEDKLSKLTKSDIEKISNNFKKRFKNPEEVQQNHQNHFFKQINDCYGIFSLSKKWNSLLMWSHYGNNHKGFCIGFREDLMRKSSLFGAGFEVNYTTKFPERNPLKRIEPIQDSFLQLGHKASEWKYEEEFRLINLKLEGLTKKDRIIKYPDEFISEVILGIEISENDKAEILKICNLKKIKVFQLSKEPFMFKLKRKLIR
ncbi:DUF2971 domain-containing protein [Dokdonia sp. R78006]|uniref:DUF2971 domain-containing protein n=1 Tax=Dokdonia sp. R78006 TaxID=3093866 RepID=UPI0036D22898